MLWVVLLRYKLDRDALSLEEMDRLLSRPITYVLVFVPLATIFKIDECYCPQLNLASYSILHSPVGSPDRRDHQNDRG